MRRSLSVGSSVTARPVSKSQNMARILNRKCAYERVQTLNNARFQPDGRRRARPARSRARVAGAARARAAVMWVVEISGSLNRDPLLPVWLELMAQLGGGRVTIVCGGGFTEEARHAHAHWRFDNSLHARNMALLALAQAGYLALCLEPKLRLAVSETSVRQILRAGHAAVWLPLESLRDQPGTETNRGFTSDRIALDPERLGNIADIPAMLRQQLQQLCPLMHFKRLELDRTGFIVSQGLAGSQLCRAGPVRRVRRVRRVSVISDSCGGGVVCHGVREGLRKRQWAQWKCCQMRATDGLTICQGQGSAQHMAQLANATWPRIRHQRVLGLKRQHRSGTTLSDRRIHATFRQRLPRRRSAQYAGSTGRPTLYSY